MSRLILRYSFKARIEVSPVALGRSLWVAVSFNRGKVLGTHKRKRKDAVLPQLLEHNVVAIVMCWGRNGCHSCKELYRVYSDI